MKKTFTIEDMQKAYCAGYSDKEKGRENRVTCKLVLKPSVFEDEKIEELHKKTLVYLNKKKPSKIPFKTTNSNLSHIKARIKEGYTYEDFKIVIDFKIKEWKGNDKTKKWIRPKTLFGSCFDGYLVEAREVRSSVDGVASDNFVEYESTENDMK